MQLDDGTGKIIRTDKMNGSGRGRPRNVLSVQGDTVCFRVHPHNRFFLKCKRKKNFLNEALQVYALHVVANVGKDEVVSDYGIDFYNAVVEFAHEQSRHAANPLSRLDGRETETTKGETENE